MARNDRTLLSRFGFEDEDRNQRLHGQACQYLATSEGAARLATLVGPRGDIRLSLSGGKWHKIERYRPGELRLAPTYELPLSKGKGDYRVIVGWLDVVIPLSFAGERDIVDKATGALIRKERCDFERPVIAEVKITPVEVDQILRQVKMYRLFIDDYLDDSLSQLRDYRFVVATRFDLAPDELDKLSNEDFYHLHLGADFQRYVSG